MTKCDEKKLDTFIHKCGRRILKIRWPMRVSNEDIRERARVKLVSEEVKAQDE